MKRKYPKEHEKEVKAFKRAHDLVKKREVNYIYWPRTAEGFAAFFKHMGKSPFRKTALIRKDTLRGYVPFNMRWIDTSSAKGEHLKDPFYAQAQREKANKRWAKEGSKERFSNYTQSRPRENGRFVKGEQQ